MKLTFPTIYRATAINVVIVVIYLGWFAVLIGLYFAWQNITATKESQVTERFYKAIEQFGATDDKGNPKLELHLRGIDALERIARDSEKHHWLIMEVLTGYVHQHSPLKAANSPANPTNPLAMDIQAILTVIGRREWRYEKSDQTLDLHQGDLNHA